MLFRSGHQAALVSRPTWTPTLPRGAFGRTLDGCAFCPCCGWRVVRYDQFCASCLAVANELGGPKPPPPAPPGLTLAAFRRDGDPSGILLSVEANNAAITAAYLAGLRGAQ